MKIPNTIAVKGHLIKVETQDTPLYQFYVCPNCVNPRTNEPLQFRADYNGSKVCPACGREDTQPVWNTYVLGHYIPYENKIRCFVSDEPHLVGTLETNFIHEVIEAVNSLGDLKLNHTQITSLAGDLYQAFKSGGINFGNTSGEVALAA